MPVFRYSLTVLILAVVFVGGLWGLGWRRKAWILKFMFQAHKGHVYSVAFSPGGRHFLSAGEDGFTRLWSAQTYQKEREFEESSGRLHTALFSPDGGRILTSSDGLTRIFDAKTGQAWLDIKVTAGDNFNGAKFSPDGKKIVIACSGQTARIWDVQKGLEIQKMSGQHMFDAQFSPDGQRVATAECGGHVHVWDWVNGTSALEILVVPIYRELGHKGEVAFAAFWPDGRKIVTASWNYGRDDDALVWDARTGEPLAVLRSPSGSIGGVFFSPDGQRFVTVGGEKCAWVWDTATSTPREALEDPGIQVLSASFSPDGREIISGGVDGRIGIWERLRPEPLWGLAALPEFWIALISGLALAGISFRKRLMRKGRGPRRNGALGCSGSTPV